MHTQIYGDIKSLFYKRLQRLYGDEADRCLRRLVYMTGRYGVGLREDLYRTQVQDWDEKDAVLITYGDMVYRDEQNKLADLCGFMNEFVGEAVSTIHLLPFFPYSSDEGFSVVDYREVRPDLGDWSTIKAITTRFDEQIQRHTVYSSDYVTRQTMQANYNIMADLVINHVSSESEWFEDFINDIQPAKNYFIEVDPETDLSKVTRPRNTSLLTPVRSRGGKAHVWTTFSSDQVDLDFSNPDVFFEFLDILLFYISQGISVIRLDAIAYLWKEIGTSCIHLPETHEVVKLIRAFIELVAPHVTIITETNVPHEENISYFGEGDEAHMVYQFSLPPLLLHAILNENGRYLTEWAQNLDDPPEGCLYFNFTASHDGIGVRPLEGLVPDREFDRLIQSTKERGGYVSYKTDEDGNESPYELNITYFDAFKDIEHGDDQLQIKRFICSQIIMLTLQGLPGIYFHSLTATPNCQEGVEKRGEKRAINRRRWNPDELRDRLNNSETTASKVFNEYRRILNIRRQHPAFNPYARQQVYDVGESLFVVLRENTDQQEAVLSISNLSSGKKKVPVNEVDLPVKVDSAYPNLLKEEKRKIEDGDLVLESFETVWLKLK